MLSFRNLTTSFKKLEIDHHKPVIIHASFTSFGDIRGGVETLLGALLASFHSILAPTFTYKCMLTPETGPENNGLTYGSTKDQNRMAEFFTKDLPADRLMGVLSEKIRLHPKAFRSTHPILSFAGINLEQAIDQQTMEKPFAPIHWLYEHQGYVLLLGVDHSVNTSIHLAEQLAGRKSFVRWGLTPNAVYECRNFPGCSGGFTQIDPILEDITKSIKIGDAKVSAIPIKAMIDELYQLFTNDPLALLCDKESCQRCEAVRIDYQNTVAVQSNA